MFLRSSSGPTQGVNPQKSHGDQEPEEPRYKFWLRLLRVLITILLAVIAIGCEFDLACICEHVFHIICDVLHFIGLVIISILY